MKEDCHPLVGAGGCAFITGTHRATWISVIGRVFPATVTVPIWNLGNTITLPGSLRLAKPAASAFVGAYAGDSIDRATAGISGSTRRALARIKSLTGFMVNFPPSMPHQRVTRPGIGTILDRLVSGCGPTALCKDFYLAPAN